MSDPMSNSGPTEPTDPWADASAAAPSSDPYAATPPAAPSAAGADPYATAAPAYGTPTSAPYGAPAYGAPAAPAYGAAAAPAYGVPAAPAYGSPAQNAYGSAPAYGVDGYGYSAPKTNTMALVSLIASCSAFVLGITAVVGVVCGHIALSQIKRTGEGGRGMAIAGLIIGYVLTALSVLAIVFFVMIIAFAASTSSPYS